MLPQALCALVVGVAVSIKYRDVCGVAPLSLFFGLLYPLYVPALSIYWAARELFWGEDKEKDLSDMKGMKMFEHLG